MSDVNKVIEVIKELPPHATIQNLLTYYPKILSDQRVSKDTEEPTKDVEPSDKPDISPEYKANSQGVVETTPSKK